MLYEHKSFVPKFIHVQLLQYLLNIWQEDLENNRPLSIILPIVFYHGRNNWIYKPFSEYFEYLDLDLKKYIPNFDYLLIDLSKHSNEKILKMQARTLISSLLLMKNAWNEKYIKLNFYEIFFKLVYAVEKEPDKLSKLLNSTITYLFNVTELKPKEVKKNIEKINLKIGDTIMKTAKRLYLEGQEIGIEIGLERGIKGVLLTSKFSINQIAKMFKVSNDYVLEVKKKLEKKK